MPPELLEYQIQPYSKVSGLMESLLSIYKNKESIYKIDIWSMGVILLEIVSGIPMWISYKCILNRKGKDVLGFGLFSSINRGFEKIIVTLLLSYSRPNKDSSVPTPRADSDTL